MRVTPWPTSAAPRRSDIVLRAESWLRPPVPHHPHRFHRNEHGIYRTDAAGYVSMAWAVLGIPPRRHGGLDVAGLVALSDVITLEEVRAGDALLFDGGRIALFHEWTDADHVACWGFEQTPDTGTVRHTIPLSGPHVSRRYRLLVEA
jgi:hypothetical protein